MKTITKEYEVLTFQELSEKVQQQLIDEERQVTLEGYDWWEGVYEQQKERLEKLGFTDVDIYFSGFWSQGDGACFDATIDLYDWMKSQKILCKYRAFAHFVLKGEATAGIRSICNHYSHENTRRAGIELEYYRDYSEKVELEMTEVEKLLEEHRYELSREIYKALEEEYDYMTSDEQMREYFECNNFEFLADGERFDV